MRGVLAALVLLATPAVAQDIRGLEVCTAEKDMTRRTSCLQANTELLQQTLSREARRSEAAFRDLSTLKTDNAALKADVAALKAALEKAQAELAELKKAKPPEKK